MCTRHWFFGLRIELKVVQHCYNLFRIIKCFLSFIFFFFFAIVVQSDVILLLFLLIVTFFFL